MELFLLFNTWPLGLPGAHLVDLIRKNGWVDPGGSGASVWCTFSA